VCDVSICFYMCFVCVDVCGRDEVRLRTGAMASRR
jgi:hypothetical protein